jgi:hypothetical protein
MRGLRIKISKLYDSLLLIAVEGNELPDVLPAKSNDM